MPASDPKSTNPPALPWTFWRVATIFLTINTVLLAILVVLYWKRSEVERQPGQEETQAAGTAPLVELDQGSWRFIVSGDSRNCGDVVMPTIAAHSARNFQPAFYWHLGDLRAIYKVDEDMAAEAQKQGEHLSCKSYLEDAWPDFIKHQIAPFGITRFYVGIGNHEVILPKKREGFSREFEDWLLTPRRQMEGVKKEDSARIAANQSAACQSVAKTTYLVPRTYYHWRQNGVEFIYLDNASGSFYFKTEAGAEDHSQEDWFDCVLDLAANDSSVKSVVVGMHEVLPYSRANNHSMCDHPENPNEATSSGCKSGIHVFNQLVKVKEHKPVYVLASHSHFYLQDVFPPASALPGWIVGTAGAVRYPLPPGVNPGPGAQKDLYGYLVGTVTNGEIKFNFQEVKESDIPSDVRRRYPAGFPNWCFSHNSQNVDALTGESTNRCTEVLPTAAPNATPPAAKAKK